MKWGGPPAAGLAPNWADGSIMAGLPVEFAYIMGDDDDVGGGVGI